MPFGEEFFKFLTNVDLIRLLDLLQRDYNVSISDVLNKDFSQHKFLWEIAGELTEEDKVKLLNLLYERDKRVAILFVLDVVLDWVSFLEHELMRIMEREARKHSR